MVWKQTYEIKLALAIYTKVVNCSDSFIFFWITLNIRLAISTIQICVLIPSRLFECRVLNELDSELCRRRLRFVRYADDCSIYVKSEKSAQRVLLSITTYLEDRLKLKVNKEKSKVSLPTESMLLGFSFYNKKEAWAIRIAKKSIERVKSKSKAITRRNNGNNTYPSEHPI